MHTWLIPMAGKGLRTQSLGEFKPFIEINNRKILFWFLFSIKELIRDSDEIIFITTSYFSKKFDVEIKVRDIFKKLSLKNKFSIIEILDSSLGQSYTVLCAEKFVNRNKPIIIANPDQYIDFELPKKIKDCYIAVYTQLGNKSGFVKIENGLITNFIEKDNISNLACAGIYVVDKATCLFDAIRMQINNGEMLKGEFYLGPAFNHIIRKSIKVLPLAVRAKYDLGDVKDVLIFEKNPLRFLSSLDKY